jgi:polar amino acid transport system substrate-binding protein
LALFVSSALVLAACAQATPTTGVGAPAGSGSVDPALQSFIAGGKFSVGDSNSRPFGWRDAGDTVKGIDPDIIRECAGRIGLPTPTFTAVEFAGLMPGVQSGRFDAIASGMVYRQDRVELADPTVPIYTVRTTLIVQKGNPLNIHQYSDLMNVSGNIGYELGSSQSEQLQRDFGRRAVGYDLTATELQDLSLGRLIGVFTNESIALLFMDANPGANIEIAKPYPPLYSSPTVFYFAKGRPALVQAFNGCVEAIKQDGTLTKIMEANNYPTDTIAPADASPLPAPAPAKK